MGRFVSSIAALSVLLSLVLVVGYGFNQSTAAKGGPLEKKMKVLKGMLRFMRKGIADESKRDECFDRIRAGLTATIEARKYEPHPLAKLEGDKKLGEMKEYRLSLIRLERHLLKVEEALINGDAVKAQELAGELKKIRDKAHDRFDVDD